MMIPTFAKYWAKELRADLKSLERLNGGINNMVFRCSAKGKRWVIKGYMSSRPGALKRMKAEVQFLAYTNKVAPDLAPGLIHTDNDRHCIILENVEGIAYGNSTRPGPNEIAEAVRFIKLLNNRPEIARQSITVKAAEGFNSLRGHILNVKRRIERFNIEHLQRGDEILAKELLKCMHMNLGRIGKNTEYILEKGKIDDEIDSRQLCISPSDFGFHNAIKTKTGIKFIDFEYAGWDDPAKTTLDFILQPRIPISRYPSPLMMAWRPEQRCKIIKRCKYLAPILALKWVCIQLSVLDPMRLQQLVDVNKEKEACQLTRAQLRDAISYMQKSRYLDSQNID
jgi:hypothetical protein